MAEDESGLRKSAILLLVLGEDIAASVLRHLGPREVQRLGLAMSTMGALAREDIEEVITEFLKTAAAHGVVHSDTDAYIRSMLTKALGDDRANNLLSRILHGGDTDGITALKWMDAPTVADLIRNDHPQIIATILAHLDFDQASDILNMFSERLRNDVILRIATLDGIQPKALAELNEVMHRIMSGASNMKKAEMGGIRPVAEILNLIGRESEASIISAVKDYDPDLAQRIQDEMFVFDNILDIEDRSIQVILREVQPDSLVLALKGTSDELKEKILRNMSQRAAEMLREDLETRGPVKLSDVEAEQKEILKVVRRLVEEGQVTIGGAGGEAMV
ncbi:MAG: flagellar motor switch protein FliG [Pseudomonadota bacterium]